MTRLPYLLGLLGFAAVGCSVFLDMAEPQQCHTTSDCEANLALRGRICQAGFCVVPTEPFVPVTTDAGGAEGCVSTALCTQNNSNRASVCKTAGGPCVPWQTDACPTIRGAWNDPNAIVIGTIGPQTLKQVDGSRPKNPYISRVLRAVDLAHDEFSEAMPQGLQFGNTRRPLAVLHCDSSLDPEIAKAAMDHLTQIVGAQALVLTIDEDLVAIAPKAIERQVAVVCTDCIGPLPDGVLAWRTTPPIASEAPLASWRVAGIEQQRAPARLRVAVLNEPTIAGRAFSQALTQRLRFNGKSATDNGADFLPVETEDLRTETVQVAAHVAAIVAFEPDVVVVAMGPDFTSYYLPLIEQDWHVAKPRPEYVATQLSNEIGLFASAIGANEDLRRRIGGTWPVRSPAVEANLSAFTVAYRRAFNFQEPDGAQGGYDAFYSLALAIAAATRGSIYDGPRVSSSFASLVGGATFDYDVTKLKPALTTLLGAAGRIDVQGTLSALDWNLATRELENDVGMFCLARESGQIVFRPDAGPRYSPRTGQITGTYATDCE
jgi:hypothetical protein